MTRTVRVSLKLLGIFIATICVFLLVVPFLGYGWHLFHRNYISYAGWKIPVPKDYLVMAGTKSPSIMKLSLGEPYFGAPYSHVSFFGHKPGGGEFKGSRDSVLFEESMSESAAKEGFRPKSKHIVAVGDKVASCLEFERNGKQPRSLVYCAVENAHIFPHFEGDAQYIPEFFSILNGMSQESVNENGEGRKKT
ncbi:MAG: hypothetical protein P4N59_14650 [Negativicutes bacterium]|nr:hypothetical protein [Negativicutes bacterium]